MQRPHGAHVKVAKAWKPDCGVGSRRAQGGQRELLTRRRGTGVLPAQLALLTPTPLATATTLGLESHPCGRQQKSGASCRAWSGGLWGTRQWERGRLSFTNSFLVPLEFWTRV